MYIYIYIYMKDQVVRLYTDPQLRKGQTIFDVRRDRRETTKNTHDN